jgi:hypothetical protein
MLLGADDPIVSQRIVEANADITTAVILTARRCLVTALDTEYGWSNCCWAPAKSIIEALDLRKVFVVNRACQRRSVINDDLA